jgi:hypothetical protein
VDQGSDNITVSADLDNTGLDDGEQDVTLEVTNASGDVVYSDTKTDVVVDAGASTTVEFSDVPAGDLSPGDYTHTIATEDDEISGSLTVNETQNGGDGNWWDPYTDSDGIATDPGIFQALSDFQSGNFDSGNLSGQDAIFLLIDSFQSQTPVGDL